MSSVGTIIGGGRAQRKRMENAILVGIPLLGTILAIPWFFKHSLNGVEATSFLIGYAVIGLGITLGLHRHFTHKSFDAGPNFRIFLGAGGFDGLSRITFALDCGSSKASCACGRMWRSTQPLR